VASASHTVDPCYIKLSKNLVSLQRSRQSPNIPLISYPMLSSGVTMPTPRERRLKHLLKPLTYYWHSNSPRTLRVTTFERIGRRIDMWRVSSLCSLRVAGRKEVGVHNIRVRVFADE
jgi:hypothetical protein